MEPQVSLTMPIIFITEGWLEIDKHYSLELCFLLKNNLRLSGNEENCIALSSKSSGWLTAGCSNFGPAVGGCGYDAMAAGRGGQGKVEP